MFAHLANVDSPYSASNLFMSCVYLHYTGYLYNVIDQSKSDCTINISKLCRQSNINWDRLSTSCRIKLCYHFQIHEFFLSSLSPWAFLLYTQCLKDSHENTDDKQWCCDVQYINVALDSIGKYMTPLINMSDQVRPVSPSVTVSMYAWKCYFCTQQFIFAESILQYNWHWSH